ncbi:AfsR/SARP family transcriptional regulator [Actinokineospora diospyrosa]|uniref:DNA-binding transcriptional activator of the SARP family n=1 Tax=Actinokineospora diospyrosa TaxID=103728 RepID=A0ABT1IJ48_9PSEU|nr:BTAD domain-containing putative transcriptional regulator [Actinokineospora diospyrosa]MCP2272679.1 DNA-binding transcriptional activator of the SARP family [Actinokineospora diospyrosa]
MGALIRLFGGVEADVGDKPVELGHRRQRAVIAVLAVEVGRVVTADQLIDRVWGDSPPLRARDTLYGYLSRLRRALTAAAAEVEVVSRAGGYVLELDPDDVDLHRFRDLVGRARTAADAQASTLYDEALTLWQGEMFGTLTSPWLDAVRTATAAERVAAERDRTDVALRLGRTSSLVAVLPALVAAHPLDERLVGQYMLALYLSGRPAEALRQYQLLRERLSEELGVDPGEALRELYQRVLREEPAVAAPGEQPRQLPAPPPFLVGRHDELAHLTKISSAGGTRVCVVGGVGGVGKTWLALHWAHQNLAEFPDGQLYVNLHGHAPATEPVPAARALGGFLLALGVDPGSVPVDEAARAALFRSRVAGRRVLVVLDNARDTAQVEPLFPGTPECMVLVTSRSRLAGLRVGGARSVEVLPLGEEGSREVLAWHLGADRMAAEPRAVAGLVERCAGLPLALGIVAARSDLPLESLLRELRDTASPLSAWDTGELSANLAEVFSWSYDAVPDVARSVFRLLGLAPGPDIDVHAAAALTDLPVGAARAALRVLENARLVERCGPDRYRSHDLLRLFAADRALQLSVVERSAALARLVTWSTRAAHAAVDAVDPHRRRIPLTVGEARVAVPAFTTADDGMAWLVREHRVLVDTVASACEAGHAVAASELAQALGRYFLLHNHHQDWLWTHHLVLEHLGRDGDPLALAETHQDLAIAHILTGDHDGAAAEFERALQLRRRLGDRRGEVAVLGNLGSLDVIRGRYRDAIRHSESAAAGYADITDRRGQANAHNTLAIVRSRLGLPAEADARMALVLFQEIDDHIGMANSESTLASICRRNGDRDEAKARFEEAIRLCGLLGYRARESDCRAEFALLCAESGRDAEARAHAAEALAFITELGAPASDSGAYNDLGEAFLRLGEVETAAVRFRQSLDTATDPYQRARAHRGLAMSSTDSSETAHHLELADTLFARLGISPP